MTYPYTSSDRLMNIYLAVSQYPGLASRIRSSMREALFKRGILTPQALETMVRERAIQSQRLEGFDDPFGEEPAENWEFRKNFVRDQITDLIFSQNLAFEQLEMIIKAVLQERGVSLSEQQLSLNPELAPLDIVLEQAQTIENLPEERRSVYSARLHESKVVLIRSLISDSLRYINIAKEWFTVNDLAEIRRRKIGAGRIGGKAAGMLLALRILKEAARPDLGCCLNAPESYYIGCNEIYTFMTVNDLIRWNDQKYKNEDEMRREYPLIVRDFVVGEFPADILDHLQTLLIKTGNRPLIVRSSSLLEDNFGTSFAGKYDSIFCPNQKSLNENLKSLTEAIARIYASTLNPDALLYRRARGLLDYDERMAILIQEVQGEAFGEYYLPHAAGVAFSRNLYRWSPQIRPEDGVVRLVWGLGTRAVERVGNDYPRLVALSHPLLRPSNDPRQVVRYSQQYVDLINLAANEFQTLPIAGVLNGDYMPLRYLAQVEEEGYFTSLRTRVLGSAASRLVLTFDELLRVTPFAERMREMLSLLEESYRNPVDVEFTLHLEERADAAPLPRITLLQCRPQSRLAEGEEFPWPEHIPPEDILFSTRFMVPQGRLTDIEYILYINPKGYFSLTTQEERARLVRSIGTLNKALDGHTFICIGPGRWGSSNSDLGVPIGFGDIYYAKALVELTGQGWSLPPEPSLGTHFFQDLLESQIYPLAVNLDDPETRFNQAVLDQAPNHAAKFCRIEKKMTGTLRLVKTADWRPEMKLNLIMSDERSLAIAYLCQPEAED